MKPCHSFLIIVLGLFFISCSGNKSFEVSLIPCEGGTNFPIGTDDSGIATVSAFLIGETEVTYKLWTTVYTWAVQNGYTFSNPGRQGAKNNSSTAITNEHPVTYINWRDVIVFCNALTEYYNYFNKTNLAYVYTSDSAYTKPIKYCSDDTKIISNIPGSYDAPYVNSSADGFRLPTTMEWECAARYQNGLVWTPGNYASGADKDFYNIDANNAVAVYSSNSNDSTAAVKSKAANDLGCYDMSGNVYEWCFDWHPSGIGSYHILRGGRWDYTSEPLQIGYISLGDPEYEADYIGFRLARNN